MQKVLKHECFRCKLLSGLVYLTLIMFVVCAYSVIDLNNKASGVYIPSIDMFIAKGEYGNSLEIAQHETGHHVWYKVLNEEERQTWQFIYNNSAQEEFVSEYAKTNYKEDFADSYKTTIHCFYDDKYLRNVSPRRADILASHYENGLYIYGDGQYELTTS